MNKKIVIILAILSNTTNIYSASKNRFFFTPVLSYNASGTFGIKPENIEETILWYTKNLFCKAKGKFGCAQQQVKKPQCVCERKNLVAHTLRVCFLTCLSAAALAAAAAAARDHFE